MAYIHDLIMTALSFGFSAYLRLGDSVLVVQKELLISGALILTLFASIVYWQMGLYRGIWRYASIRDFTTIAKAATLTILIFLCVMFVWTRLEFLPRSLPVINLLVLMAMLGGPRLAYRIIKDKSLDLKDAPDGTRRIPVLLIGADDGAELFIRSLMRESCSQYRIVGIVTDNPGRVGQQIHGFPILSSINQLSQTIDIIHRRDEKPQRLIITKETFDGALIREMLDEAARLGISIARLPRMTDFKSGDPSKLEIRPIDVEDLLGRPQTALNKKTMEEFLIDRSILITGAGGSIGTELSHQIAKFSPAKIVLLDSSEYGVYLIDQELKKFFPNIFCIPIIADIRDQMRLENIFEKYDPDVVFHAAALKHVPLVEYNCCEGIMTNVIGTINVSNACKKFGVKMMVQISTDKAINPTNVMGATKRLAERYCQALDLEPSDTRITNFVTVRFGNVLGSTGSVVPLFQKQLQEGGPLTVTHPEMTRYFMTTREAVELVLLASATAQPGKEQDGKIFVLDMGEPVKIMDLAKQMIHLAGYELGKQIEIKITGIRPGEKLFEELYTEQESLRTGVCNNYYIIGNNRITSLWR